MFTDAQKKDLLAPLNKANVKTRKQAGRDLSYIEGWKAIEEANRIFGFDGWTRETTEIKCVSEKEREIGQSKLAGYGVSYIARVRIVVFAGDSLVTREGIGAGHGIDRDLGQAHESAIKEAETDAMKRALMTFGYQFGLALYDKEQEHVTDDSKPEPRQLLSEPVAAETQARLIEEINGCVTKPELEKFALSEAFQHRINALPEKHRSHVRSAYRDRADQLKARAA